MSENFNFLTKIYIMLSIQYISRSRSIDVKYTKYKIFEIT